MDWRASNQSVTLKPTRVNAIFAVALLFFSGASALSGVGERRHQIVGRRHELPSQSTKLPSQNAEDDCVSVDENDECLNKLKTDKPIFFECSQVNDVIVGRSHSLRAEHLAKPCYPRLAKFARLSGTVEVEFVVDEAGNVVWAEIQKGHSLLRDAALKAVCVSRFRPADCSGRLIMANERVIYHFILS